MKRRGVLIAVAVALLAFPRPAAAYLDPVTGSLVWQVVVGGLLAAGVTIRIYWNKLRSWFSKKPRGVNSEEP
jgi:hypothetical protein